MGKLAVHSSINGQFSSGRILAFFQTTLVSELHWSPLSSHSLSICLSVAFLGKASAVLPLEILMILEKCEKKNICITSQSHSSYCTSFHFRLVFFFCSTKSVKNMSPRRGAILKLSSLQETACIGTRTRGRPPTRGSWWCRCEGTRAFSLQRFCLADPKQKKKSGHITSHIFSLDKSW